MAVFSIGQVWGEITSPYTHTFAKNQLGTASGAKTLSSVSWTQSTATYIGWDANRGVQIGSKNSPQSGSAFTLTSTAFSGAITKVEITACAYNATDSKLNVSVGGITYNSEVTLGTTATTHEFTGNESGTIIISMQTGSSGRAMYLKEIKVTFGSSSGGGGQQTTVKFRPFFAHFCPIRFSVS